MGRPIIATALRGLYLKQDIWIEAQNKWFEEIAREIEDPEFTGWSVRENYFDGVDLAMEQLYPELEETARTVKARERYFRCVLRVLREHPEPTNPQVIVFMRSFKATHQLALVTPDTGEALDEILLESGLEGLFDIIMTGENHERVDRKAVYERFIQRYRAPALFIGASRAVPYEYWMRRHIPAIFASLDGGEPVEGVHTVHSFEEFQKAVRDVLSG